MNNNSTRWEQHKQSHHCLKPAYAAVLLAFAVQTVQANPVGGNVVNGNASFATSGNTLTVTNTPGTIINWQGFSISANEVTNFAQQSASSSVLNRVVSNNPSSIQGTLKSNGRVFLINPNGIVFGAGSVVDVAGLVASTLNLSNADFLAGNHHFTEVQGAGNISNAGKINAHEGGQIFLIASDVENTGVITAPNGEILLAAGHSVDLVSTDDPNLRVNITAPAGDVTNVGQLIASSGSLGLFGTVVRNSGTVSADSATMQGGKIVFKASQRVEAGGTISANGRSGGSVNIGADHSADPDVPGVVIQTGVISAQGSTGAGGSVGMSGDSIFSTAAISVNGAIAGGQISVQATNRALSTSSAKYTANSRFGSGGDILVSADVSNYTSGSYGALGATGGNITLAGNEIKLAGAQLNASGKAGGGTIHVGGLMHGATGFSAQGTTLVNATNVLVNSSTTLKADALKTGNGGEVVLWSDQAMRFTGKISAKGGTRSGNGGYAEVSGLTSLAYGGLTNLSARHGLNGTLLLDPLNITIVAGTGPSAGSPYQEIFDPTPGAGEGFGGSQNLELGNGNIVITSPSDSAFGANSGAVYMYDSSGSLLSAVVGSSPGDKIGAYTIYNYGGVSLLGNGNIIITSDNWNGGMGAVTWMSASGLLSTGSAGGPVSSSNSLVGSTAGDKIGTIGNTSGLTLLGNGNLVIASTSWNNGGAVAGAGAVTWMNGATGELANSTIGVPVYGGVVSAANSLVGGEAGDTVGSGGISVLTDNSTFWNVAVRSNQWGSGGLAANALGAVTWMDGATGALSNGLPGGAVDSTNSLIGTTAGDKVGTLSLTQVNSGTPYTYDYSGISVGANGNLVISSNNWNNGGSAAGAGAVTWMNGASGGLVGGGVGGAVSSTNSLVGTAAGDKVGTIDSKPYYWLTQESSGIVWLPNGNYLVRSGQWGSAGIASAGKGAVTWASGSSGVAGAVSSSNSIVGSATYDLVGAGWTDATTADPGLVVLSNGNYVVISSQWSSGTGAVTFGDGSNGTSGVVSGIASAGIAFSLVGSGPGSFVGSQGIAVQYYGGNNYVVRSPFYDLVSGTTDVGALTWMNGKTGALSNGTFGGTVNSTNSLLGGSAYDNVGAVTALYNGNFLATTPTWSGGLGAMTWMSGSTGKLADLSNGGTISSTNSLVGSTGGDMSGNSIIQLTSGNILLKNPNWDNGANLDVGALTWMNGLTGELSNSTVGTPVYGGVIGTSNSLVGAYGGVWNGSYYAGREQVGDAGITELGSGNIVVQTYTWHNPTTSADNAGAVTWMNGTTGKLVDGSAGGTITELNSLVGDVASSQIGNYNIILLSNGNVVLRSPQWNGSRGAVTWMNGVTGALSDGTSAGVISAANSVIGSTANDSVGSDGVAEVTDYATFWNYVVRSSNWNAYAGAITWVNGTTGKTSDGSGIISSANSLVGSSASDYIGSSTSGTMLQLSNGNVVFADQFWGGGKGAVTWMNGANGQLADTSQGGVVSATNSLVGSTPDSVSTGDRIGSGGMTEITDYSTFWNYAVLSPEWSNGAVTGAGAVTLGNGATGKAGVVSSSNSLVGSATGDRVGSGGITKVTNNSTFWNFVVSSPDWGSAGVYQAGKGAVTWMNGKTGALSNGSSNGAVDSTNSLTGSLAGDQVGVASSSSYSSLQGVNAFSNGNLLIRSQHWKGEFSALTWISGATGKLANGATGGVVSSSNSLLGGTIYDNLGGGMVGLTELVNGNWVITSPDWGGGGLQGLGAATWMNSATGQLADGTFGGKLSASNSLVGSGATPRNLDAFCDCSAPGGVLALSDGNYVVYWQDDYPAYISTLVWGNGTSGTAAAVDGTNSLSMSELNVMEMNTQPGRVLVGSDIANGGMGGVYLLGGTASGVSGYLFADSPGVDATVGADTIASTLNLGTNVVLQANNDITESAGAAINAAGNGNLTLQAGRSVILDGTINIKGSLDITANDPSALQQYRSPGTAVLDTSLATLTAGKVNLTNFAGDVSIGIIHGGSGAVTVNAAGGNFNNNSGTATPITTTGKISIYSTDPTLDTLNGMGSNFHRYNCTYALGCVTPGTVTPTTGTGFFYSIAPVLTVTANPISKTYGTLDSSALTYSVTNYLPGDSASNAPMGGSLAHTGGENVGTGYTITQGSLLNQMGYSITFTGSTLNITPATLTVSANATSKVLNTADPLLTYTVSGLQFGETAAATLNGGSLIRVPGETVGNYQINQGSLALALVSTNYTMTYVPGTFTILVPTVINEIVDISNQRRKIPPEEVLAVNIPTGDGGNMQSLPMCN